MSSCPYPIPINHSNGLRLSFRCGHCLNCRIVRQSQLALRNILEDREATASWFLTLTYAEEPEVLPYPDVQTFFKRLRQRHVRSNPSAPLRYFVVGEYGEKSGRPHWHALVYNLERPDWIAECWPHGFVQVAEVNSARINYASRYCLKWSERDQEHGTPSAWSKCPPLGVPGARVLAREMLRQGYEFPAPPPYLRIGKRSYPLDYTLMRAWSQETGCPLPRFGQVAMMINNADWIVEARDGYPLKEKAKAREARRRWHLTNKPRQAF